MRLRHDTNIDENEIYHSGNHGNMGNPHSQYSATFNTITCNSAKANMSGKWFETAEIPIAFSPQIKIQAMVYARQSEIATKTRGIVDIEIFKSETTPFNFACNMVYQDLRTTGVLDGSCFSAYVEHRYVGNAARECYVVKLYFSPQNSYETVIIIPTFIDVNFNKSWSTYVNSNSRYDNYILMSNIATDKTLFTDTLIGTSTLAPFLSGNNQIIITTGTTFDMSRHGLITPTFASATTIAQFANGTSGQTATIQPTNANITLTNSATLVLKGGIDVTIPSYKMLVFICINPNYWLEIWRSF
jgi:hypothetical protein